MTRDDSLEHMNVCFIWPTIECDMIVCVGGNMMCYLQKVIIE
jgi:hypothetical protein